MPYKSKEDKKQYYLQHKEYFNKLDVIRAKIRRDNRRANGLCSKCNQPHSENSTYCLFHLIYCGMQKRNSRKKLKNRISVSQRNKNRRIKLKAENRCTACGMPLDDESRMGLQCVNCQNRIVKLGIRRIN